MGLVTPLPNTRRAKEPLLYFPRRSTGVGTIPAAGRHSATSLAGLEERSEALPTADAHGHDSVAATRALQLSEQ